MNKSKPVAKKQKATNQKKAATGKSSTSAKPIKLGGVPNRGGIN
jgi:hypothetical protein